MAEERVLMYRRRNKSSAPSFVAIPAKWSADFAPDEKGK
jgi:hypothetical protein